MLGVARVRRSWRQGEPCTGGRRWVPGTDRAAQLSAAGDSPGSRSPRWASGPYRRLGICPDVAWAGGVWKSYAQTALNATLRYCPVLATEPGERLTAIVDFTFNLGAGRLQTSTLRRRLNQRDWAASAQELGRWIYGGGQVLPGLVARRRAEASLILDLRY